MKPPPLLVRRLVIAPAIVLLAFLMVAAAPLWLVVGLAVTSLVPGRFRIPRVLLLVTVYLVWSSLCLVALFVMWVISGFGLTIHNPEFERAHYRLAAWALRTLFAIFGRVLRLDIVMGGSDEEDPAVAEADFRALFAPGTPLVVASRHAGPGDSFILVHTLLNEVHREPRVVLKDTLKWDPTLDVLLHRIPAGFITTTGFATETSGETGDAPADAKAASRARSAAIEQQLHDLATGLDGDDAFVIFPEGGNVTSARRRSRIERLKHSGRPELAERAEAMTHVMAPQPGGMHTALDAAPDADVVFIGHSDLDTLVTVGDIWRELPMDKRITMRAWRVPRSEIPADRDAQAEWLFSWFEQIDQWINEHKSDSATPV